MENILIHMQCIHDQELDMTREESDKFTWHIIKRHRNKIPNLCPISDTSNKGKTLCMFLLPKENICLPRFIVRREFRVSVALFYKRNIGYARYTDFCAGYGARFERVGEF